MMPSLPQLLQMAVDLGLADRIGSGEREVHELAAACNTEAESLLRLLRGLASLGLLAQTGPQRFALTPMASVLEREGGGRWQRFTHLASEMPGPALEPLLQGVRNGANAFHQRHGCSVLAWSRRHPAPRLEQAHRRHKHS
jgi:hypothetical protein